MDSQRPQSSKSLIISIFSILPDKPFVRWASDIYFMSIYVDVVNTPLFFILSVPYCICIQIHLKMFVLEPSQTMVTSSDPVNRQQTPAESDRQSDEHKERLPTSLDNQSTGIT